VFQALEAGSVVGRAVLDVAGKATAVPQDRRVSGTGRGT